MPNWCYNSLEVSGPERVLQAWVNNLDRNAGSMIGFLGTFVIPEYNIAGDDWYERHLEFWGTKWDVPVNEVRVIFESPSANKYGFDTAWSPPINWMERVSKDWPSLDFRLWFEEEGMGFLGYAIAKDGECFVEDAEFPDSDDSLWFLEDDSDKRDAMEERWEAAVSLQREICELKVEQEFFDSRGVSEHNAEREAESMMIGDAYDKAE